MTTFDPDQITAADGPEWLRRRRLAAWERFGGRSMPTTEDEVWRYSRIADLDLDEWQPAPVPDGGAVDVPTVGARSALVVVVDGHVVAAEVDPAAAAKGVRAGRLAELDADGTSLGSVRGDAESAVGDLHDAFAGDPVLVDVPAGVVLEAPIVVVHQALADDVASFPHLVVRAGADSEVTVYDHQCSAGDRRALVVPVVELDVADAARVRYLGAQVHGPRVWQLGRQASRVGQDASFNTTTVALGGDYARLTIDSTMAGRGGSGEMFAVWFGEADQTHDFRTMQDHLAPNTTSNLVFKGAVQDRSRSVYTGLIHIGKQARGVNAFQTNRNIKLSEDSWAESVPNLEIENNDVRCSHASAVGPVDEDQRFYLESRGVQPATAERLIVLGFFEEVLARLSVPAAAGPLRAEIAAKLDRREAAQP
jgi:Fe-S cluster assembly protein SufD